MSLILFVVVGLLLWALVAFKIDIVGQQAWKARDAYQRLSFVLMFLLILVVFKASEYRGEIRQLIVQIHDQK